MTVQVTPAVVALTQPVTLTVSATDNVAVTTRTLRVLGPALPNGLVLPLDATGRDAILAPDAAGFDEAPARRFTLGVLWHPEAGEDMALFAALVAEAAEYAASK